MKREKEYFRGCPWAAPWAMSLGWPVEFFEDGGDRATLRQRGISEPELGPSGKAEITDDTQMTLYSRGTPQSPKQVF